VSERAGRQTGCFIVAEPRLGRLPERPMFWRLDTYATRAAAVLIVLHDSARPSGSPARTGLPGACAAGA